MGGGLGSQAPQVCCIQARLCLLHTHIIANASDWLMGGAIYRSILNVSVVVT